jgi:amidase
VLETGFGGQENVDAAPVSKVVMAAVDTLAHHGVKVSRNLTIDNLGQWIADTSLYIKQSKIDISAFLAARESSPVSSFMEIYASGKFNPLNDLFHNIADGPESLEGDAEYMQLRLNREDFRHVVLTLFAENGVDFLVYPTVQVVPPRQTELEDGKYTALTFPTNTVLGSQTGFPALTIPVGFTPDGLPVGMELLGKPFAEAEMLQFASAWEKTASHRQAPVLD